MSNYEGKHKKSSETHVKDLSELGESLERSKGGDEGQTRVRKGRKGEWKAI